MANRIWAASHRGVVGVLMAIGLVVGASSAQAAGYPEKAIEMTVLFGSGSGADLTARVLADGMSKRLKVPVPVVNRTGGGGAVGYAYLKDRPADGYAIVWNSDSVVTAYHLGNMHFNYSAFTPVARVSTEVPALAVRSDSPWKSLKDLMQAAKKAPNTIKIGISGIGSFTHLASAALFAAGGVEIRYIPYGEGQATVELLGGRIDAALQWPSVFKSNVEAGKLRILCVTSDKRIALLPNVPTAKEQGYNVDYVIWRGIAGPKGMPPQVVATLEKAIRETVEGPEFKAAGEKLGFTPAYLPSGKFGELIARTDQEDAEIMKRLELSKQ
jgi:tripartite-type tricarboxylate transporter receptor subunit TctC